MALGVLLLADLIGRAGSLRSFYTDASLFPRPLAIWFTSPRDFSLYFSSGSLLWPAVLFLIAGLFAILLLVGCRTRWATLASWLLFLSLENRNTLVPSGGDYMLRLVLFWSLFLPLGARFSLDRALDSTREAPPKRWLSLGSMALFLQIAMVYLSAGISKMGSDVWKNGTAVYYALGLEHYATPLGLYLFHHAPVWLLKVLTYSVVSFELIGPILLFAPVFTARFRAGALLCFALMQLGFGSCIELELFPWIAVALLIPFIPSAFWDSTVKSFLARFSFSWQNLVAPWESRIRMRLPVRPLPRRALLWTQIFPALFLIYILLSNLEGLTGKFLIPSSVRWMGDLLNLDQAWSMYVPPGEFSVWFVAPGKLKDGTQVDLFKKGEPVRWEKPVPVSRSFRSGHWKSYLLTLWGDPRRTFSAYLGWNLCQEWNQQHRGTDSLEELEVFAVSQHTLLTRQTAPPQKQSLFKYSCFPKTAAAPAS